MFVNPFSWSHAFAQNIERPFGTASVFEASDCGFLNAQQQPGRTTVVCIGTVNHQNVKAASALVIYINGGKRFRGQEVTYLTRKSGEQTAKSGVIPYQVKETPIAGQIYLPLSTLDIGKDLSGISRLIVTRVSTRKELDFSVGRFKAEKIQLEDFSKFLTFL